jgi:Dolichyl-phosphate-mannose-protein mannosyltransferase
MLKFFFAGAPVWLRNVLLAVILVSSLGMMSYAAYHESATFDESAHIPAGYSYVKLLDYRLNPEHPPLLKALAAAPLLFLNLNFPTQIDAWQKDVNGQWAVGGNFFYNSGNDAAKIVRMARIMPILLTILLSLLIYMWSARLIGRWMALVPTFLFAWSPNVLAHGHYVTTDVGAAFGIALTIMCFLQFLFKPSRRHLLYAGLAFGVAQLLKFSAVLLIPYLLVLIALYYVLTVTRDWHDTEARARLKRFFIRGFHYLRSTVFVFVIGYVLVVYPIYFLFTAHYPLDRQTHDTQIILQNFGGGAVPAGQHCGIMRCLADGTIWGAGHRITQPFAEYSLGVLTALERTENGNANYFLGRVSGSGTWYYFPTVYALKEPIAILLFLLIGFIFAGRRLWKKIRSSRRGSEHATLATSGADRGMIVQQLPGSSDGAPRTPISVKLLSEGSFTAIALLLFVAIYWFSSIRSPLNIGFRHLFPTLPLMYILASLAWERWMFGGESKGTEQGVAPFATALLRIQRLPKIIFGGSVIAIIILWLGLETVVAAPHFLSYWNEMAGGSSEGYRFATDSNYDWGQDLYYLNDFVNAHPEIDKIAVDYFGGGSPGYTLGAKEENWWSSRGNPAASGIHWFAVSVNTLSGSMSPTKGFFERKPEDEYRWLRDAKPATDAGLGALPTPDYRAGQSIFIYKL